MIDRDTLYNIGKFVTSYLDLPNYECVYNIKNYNKLYFIDKKNGITLDKYYDEISKYLSVYEDTKEENCISILFENLSNKKEKFIKNSLSRALDTIDYKIIKKKLAKSAFFKNNDKEESYNYNYYRVLIKEKEKENQ